MAQVSENRSKVITDEQAKILATYLGFRHFYRHSYSHFLDWDDLEKLVTPLYITWHDLRPQLQRFVDTLAEP
ncbi:MAG: hypothetical protein KDE47_20760 [Caldilineaceae bacterium]|nr:hypothetical protein [Caldilineaceae bacterium]